MDATFTGIDVVGLGEENMFKILDDLIYDLENGAPNDKLTLYLGKLTTVQDRLLTCTVELGARTQKLDTMENRYSLDFINAEAVRTDIEDIDQEYTIMQMKFAEAVYRQALAVGARVIQPTLLDFLR
jgi:flagellar hook-associated protein 3 FlgL